MSFCNNQNCQNCQNCNCYRRRQFFYDKQIDDDNSFYNTSNYSKKRDSKGKSSYVVISTSLYLVLTYWAMFLALKQPAEHSCRRIIHVTLAFLFSPIYIIAYYVSYMK